MAFASQRIRRILDRRGLRLWVVVIAPIGVGASMIVLLWFPLLIRSQIASRIESRTGLPVKVGAISVGFGSIDVHELRVGESVSAPLATAREVALDSGPLMLALRGTRALDAIEVGELAIRVPLHTPATRAFLERVLARREGQAPEPARALPAIEIQKITLELRDEYGVLASVIGAKVSSNTNAIQMDAEKVTLGASPETQLELARVSLAAQRSAAGIALESFQVGRARIALAGDSGQPAQTAAAEESDDEASAHKPAPEPASQRTWPRLRHALALVRGARGERAASQPASDAASKSVFDRLAPDAVLKLEGASIAVASAPAPILESLSVTLKMQKDRALSVVGSGKAHGEGELGFDLTVRPELARADGQLRVRALPLTLFLPFLPGVPLNEADQGKVDAELVIKTEPAQGIAFKGDASVRNAAIFSPRIAPTPVHGIDLALHGRGRLLPLARRLEVEQGELMLRGTPLEVTGAVEWSTDHYLFDIDATLPKTACNKAVHSIPEDLLGDMAVATFQGKIGGHFRLKLDSRKLEDTELTLAPEDHCEFITVPAIADLRRFRMPFIHSVVEPDGKVFEMETGPGTDNWSFIEDISPFLVHAVLAHEDAGFFTHHGFSPRHIRDALVRNLKEGRYVVGASTITMQLVKNVFLHREKTLARKIQEVLLTWWIERMMEKRDIIELYLNVIEYGPSVYGIKNAARHYFNRLPSQLSPAESIYLATILPNPKHYHVMFERGSLSPGWIDQMRQMFARMRAREWYSPEAVDYGLKELENFHFAKEGSIVPPREIPGSAAPLPYMQGGPGQAGWDDEEEANSAPKPAAPAVKKYAKDNDLRIEPRFFGPAKTNTAQDQLPARTR